MNFGLTYSIATEPSKRQTPPARFLSGITCLISAASALIPLATPSYAADDSVAAYIQSCRASAKPISELNPIPNGPGVIICAPVASRGLENAGKGISAWINLYVGGDPRCSKTPAIDDLVRAGKELRHPGLALNLAQAGKLSRMTGATDIAVGTLTGTAAHCKLQYQMYAMSSNLTDGSPIVMEGSLDQIASRLPELADSALHSLEMEDNKLPKASMLSGSDLAFLGTINPRDSFLKLSHADQMRLHALAKRSLLGAVLWHCTLRFVPKISKEAPFILAASSLIVSMAPSNAIAMAEVSRGSTRELIQYENLFEKNTGRVSTCYLYYSACAWAFGGLDQWILERNAAEMAVCCAPDNPRAWISLAHAIGEECDAVRRGSTFDTMRADVQEYVSETYPDWAMCCKKATIIDPYYGLAWLRLSTAACFAGDEAEADSAYWQAAALEPTSETFWWGLQMYQPKWLDDESRLAKVVVLATRAPYETRADAEYVAKALDEVKFSDNAAKLRKKYARKK